MNPARVIRIGWLAALLLARPTPAAETNLLSQGFEAGDTWAIVAGAGQVAADDGPGDAPPGERVRTGLASWQVNNGNHTLVLAQAALPAVTGRLVRLHLSSTTLAPLNGSEVSDAVRVFVALDGAAFDATPDLHVGGNSNARWGYWATQTVTTAAGTLASNAAPQGGTSSNNFATLQVLLPNSATSVAVSVSALNNDTNEFWNVDDVAVVALVSPATNLTFAAAGASANEAAGAVTVTVFKTAGAGNVSAQLALAGSAAAGSDYSVSTTNLTLNGAVTAATVVVTLVNDGTVESAETVVLALTNVVGGGLVAPATFTLTVVDNDLSPAAVSNVWINEISYDPLGGDTNEFIEVAGVAGTDLSTCSLVLYNGTSGLTYGTTNLAGTLDNEGCGFGAVAVSFPTNFLRNGAPDGVALVQDGAVVQFLAYEGAFTAADGPAANLTTTTNIGDSGLNSTNSLQLSGTATSATGFTWSVSVPSPGVLNFIQHITGCTDPIRLSFSPAAQSISEAGGSVDVLIFKSAALSNVTAQLVLSGTATPGADVIVATTNLVLAGATTSQVVTLTLVDDLELEPAETLTLTLTNLVAAVPGYPSSYTLTLNANDTLSLAATSAALFAQSAVVVAVAGTANNVLVGELSWTNPLNGAAGSAPAATNWSLPAVPLAVGLNPVTITGTNGFGDAITITHAITRLDLPRAGPAVIAAQDFEPADTWTLVQGAALVSTNAGAADFPPGQRIAAGTQSWQVAGGSATLELAQVSMSGFTGRQVQVRLASTSLTAGNGAESSDLVWCYVALDGAPFPADTNYVIGVGGSVNARWGFWSTNTAAMADGAQARVFAPQGGLSSNNYSDLYLLLPDGATSVAVKVWARNSDPNEVWSVDAIRLTGYAPGGSPDADGDLMPDAWELDQFGTTTNAAGGDRDGDGFSNLDEYVAGTHATNSAAYLRLSSISNAPGATLGFTGVTGRLYRLDYRDQLPGAGSWTEFTNGIAGTNGLMRVVHGGVTNQRNYRVRVQLP